MEPVPDQQRRFLVFVSDRIGDVLFCTPALRLLREAAPDARIEVMAQSHAALEVLCGNPNVDHSFLDTDAVRVARGARFDTLLDFKNNRTSREAANLFGLTPERSQRLPNGPSHEAEVALACVERVTGHGWGGSSRPYELFPSAADDARATTLLTEAGVVPGDVLVGCHMGCNRVARRGWKFWKPLTHPKAWPVDSFRQLEEALRGAVPRLRLVLTGSPGEAVLARQLAAAGSRPINLIGRTSVLELAAVLKRLRLFVTADTGPLHVACAAGVPIVCLFGATPVSWFGPWPARPDRVVLEADPVASISVASVRDAVLTQLAASTAPAVPAGSPPLALPRNSSSQRGAARA